MAAGRHRENTMVDVTRLRRKMRADRSCERNLLLASTAKPSCRGSATLTLSRRATALMPSIPRLDWSDRAQHLLVYSPGDPTGTSHIGVCDVTNGLSVTPIDVHGG